MQRNSPAGDADIGALERRATQLRRHMLMMARGQGQGYIGQGLGLRMDRSDARVFVELSDGEMQEGSTWEAAMSASHFRLDGLVALVDCNGIQADGPVVLDMEPVADRWR